MIPIGTQFYRAPTPLKESWEKDLQTARAHGLNIIRGWLMWNWMHPAENRFDFSDIEDLLEASRKASMKVILLFNLESAPAWLVKKHPEAIYVSHIDRKYYPESIGNTPAGGFPGLCFHHQPVVEHGKRFIAEVVKRYKNHPALFGYEPHNEPLFEPSRYNNEVYCYCSRTLEEFQQWLAHKYGNDIDKLNFVWKRKYGSFDEVYPPRKRGIYADWVDWRLFYMESLQKTLQWRIQTIRDNDSTHPVLIHTRGGAGVTRPAATEGIDDWAFARMADMYGTAAFPQCGPEQEYFIAMAGARSASKGKEFWMSELQGGQYGMGVHRNDAEPKCFICNSSTMEATRDVQVSEFDPGEVTAERLKMWMWSGIAQGAKGILFWQYRWETFGLEYGFGLTNMDGTPSERLLAVKEMSGIIHSREELFKKASLPDIKIAIAVTPINDIINFAALGCTCQIKNSIKGLHKVLWNTDYLVDFVRIDELVTDMSYDDYKVIYVPFPVWISKRSVEKLKDWVARGGTLVVEASAGQLDENFFTSIKVPGMGLDELLGCERADIRSMKNVPRLVYKGKKILTGFYKEVLKPTTGKVIGTFETGEPAIVMNHWGKGKTFYIGSNPFYSYNQYEDPNLIPFIHDINKEVPREVYCNHKSVTARLLKAGNQWIIFQLNTLNRPVDATLTIEGKGKLTDLFTGKTVKAEVKGKHTILRKRLTPFATQVFLMERK